MSVIGYDPYISVDAAWTLSRNVKKAKSYKEIYENSDYITIHAPVNKETSGMINENTIAQMKKSVRIMNFSRNELVNNDDMAVALEKGRVSAYVTDFPNEATLKMKNAINIPHLGASTPEAEENCAEMAAHQLAEFMETGNIVNSVNFGNAVLPISDGVRICIIHKNIPNMLTQISGTVSETGLNIENMINTSKKDYAYTIFNIDGSSIKQEIIDKITAIEGVIKVRTITM